MTSKHSQNNPTDPDKSNPVKRSRGDRSAEYKRDYQRRLERAREANHRNRASFDKARAVPYAVKPRDSRREYQRQRELAAREGFQSVTERRKALTAASPKRAMLAKFHVTEREFEAMRKENLGWARPAFENWNPRTGDVDKKKKNQYVALRINEYNVDLDIDPDEWSERRVGYITSFNRAVVNPRYNYSSLFDSDGLRRIDKRTGKPMTNRFQADLLVKYGEIMEISEFERRYGAIL